MPKTIFYTASTLNGFLADPEDSLAWLFEVPQEEVTGDIEAFTAGIGVLVEGSATYEWTVRENGLLAEPDRWTEYYGDRPTYVFTSRQLPLVPDADVRFVSGSVADHYAEIAEAAGDRDIWLVGGGDLVGQFADAGLLDEVIVTFAPATLAAGKPLLPRALGADRLTLTGVRQIGPYAELSYRVSPAGSVDSTAVTDSTDG
ncbi:dihydrofolate reductase [Microbacterium resistens]|uniref:Dihydrofolate reductase n=1 Tax=Microbacterium resistens TaxID=156977 RepID=A0ABU1SHM8_9MICO|nr:dihydrofolate reductase family protein [Microbacterium resistens]MDR6868508.1 dihydrofolate reductase [Microbacterium resistens]